MKMGFVIVFVGLAIFLSPGTEVFANSKNAGKTVEKSLEKSSNKTTPAKTVSLQEALALACRDHSQLKDSNASQKVCACVAKNHATQSSESQMKRLVARYQAGLKGLKALNPDESMLFDFDLKLAEACLENPDFQVPAGQSN